jgi:hypothetical protein
VDSSLCCPCVDVPFRHVSSSNDEIYATCVIDMKLWSQLVGESVEAHCMPVAVVDTLLGVEAGNWDARSVGLGTVVVVELFRTSADCNLDSSCTFEIDCRGLSRTDEEGWRHTVVVEWYRNMKRKTGQSAVVVEGCLVVSTDSKGLAWCGIVVGGCHIGPGLDLAVCIAENLDCTCFSLPAVSYFVNSLNCGKERCCVL